MKNAVQSRGIKYLWHFTRIENIDSILQNGLIPRATLESQQSTIIYNDHIRVDNQTETNCLSISHPNYKMFFPLRQTYPRQEWVVIGIEPDILWQKNCAFCIENAASNNVRHIPIDERKGIHAFNTLFDEACGKPTRNSISLPANCPTNPQAEVLVFGVIEPEYIIGAVTQNNAAKDVLKARHPDFYFEYHKSLFLPRIGYQHW